MSKMEKLVREDSDINWRTSARKRAKELLQSPYTAAGLIAGAAWWLDPTGIGMLGEALTFGIKLVASAVVVGGAKSVAVGLLEHQQTADDKRHKKIVAKIEAQKVKLLTEHRDAEFVEEEVSPEDEGVPPSRSRTY